MMMIQRDSVPTCFIYKEDDLINILYEAVPISAVIFQSYFIR